MSDPKLPAAASAPRPAWLDLHARAVKWLQRYATMPNKRGEAYVLVRDLLAACPPPAEARDWQPIKTAPDKTLVIGALIRDGKVWRVHEMKHNGLAWYTAVGGSLPQMTHWMPLPDPPGRAPGRPEGPTP